MAKKKFVVGCFDEEKVLFPAVKKYALPATKYMTFILPSLYMASTMRWVLEKQAFIPPGLFMRCVVPVLLWVA